LQAQVKTGVIKEALWIIGSDNIINEESESQVENIALLLEEQHYKVHRFYDPNNEWKAIKKASLNASLFIYRGHGTHAGIDGGFGGIVIDEFVSGETIASELKFNLKPLVIFISACGGAESSAGDETDIGVEEAKNRALGSGLPFMLAGAAGYYANNYSDGAYNFLENWFSNKPLNDCYISSIYPWCSIRENVLQSDPRIDTSYHIAVSSSPDKSIRTVTTIINGKTTTKNIFCEFSYSIAYLGDPQLTLNKSLVKVVKYAKN
jgi:hypothetical protein